MDIETIKAFCLVSKYKSFRKAAEVLNITQPGVSRRIQSLEDELGAPLFLRTPQSVVLTKQGKDFLPYAERTVSIIDEGAGRVMEGVKMEGLVIGGTPTVSFNFLPKVLKEFYLSYSTCVTLYTAPSERIFDMLLDQTIDIGFTTAVYANPLVKYEKICEEEIICVAQPAAVEKYMGENEIKHPIPIICNHINSPLWESVNQQFIGNPLYEVVIKAQYTTAVEQLARIGLGFGVLPKSDAIPGLKSGELIEVSLPDLVLPKREVFLLTYNNKHMKNSVIHFRKTLRDYKHP